MAEGPHIDISSLPDASLTSFDFIETSFFQNHGSVLPAPATVRELAGPGSSTPQPPPVKFPHLDLLVKFGPHVSITEALCLWMIRKAFGSRIPVPEVYAWRVDQQETYIYMQLVRGDSLKDRWESLSFTDRAIVCTDLYHMVSSLRSAVVVPDSPFIGSVNGGPVTDIIFEGIPNSGPFSTVESFHNWLSSLLWYKLPQSPNRIDPWREYLPDNEAIVLTHGDLHRSNIIISSTGSPHVISIVDWAQAGWYPAYWEYCKACYTASFKEEWRNDWIPKFLDRWDDEFLTLSEYTHAIGSV